VDDIIKPGTMPKAPDRTQDWALPERFPDTPYRRCCGWCQGGDRPNCAHCGGGFGSVPASEAL
jgi:hypothetical protein